MPWVAASEENKVKFIAAVEKQIKNPSSSPENAHIRWLKSKEGWTLGEFDKEKKTHPCICAYNDLSAKQQIKDKLFMKLIKILKPLL